MFRRGFLQGLIGAVAGLLGVKGRRSSEMADRVEAWMAECAKAETKWPDGKTSHSGHPLDPFASPWLEKATSSRPLAEVLERMRQSEINFHLSHFYDSGYLVALGDEMNGYKGHCTVDYPEEAAGWFEKHAEEIWPDSDFARYDWWVYGTVLEGRAILVECRKTGARSSVDDPTEEELSKAFHSPTKPYFWPEAWRVAGVAE